MNMVMHEAFKYFRPDEVAECWDGVSDELYARLWASMERMKPLSKQIDIEESGPGDALGLNSMTEVWEFFTPDEQAELNRLAVEAQ